MKRTRTMYRKKGLIALTLFAALGVAMLLPTSTGAVVAGAGYTTNNPAEDGDGTCLNGSKDPLPAVNCNQYGSKDYVWLNGGPSAGQNSLTDGTYFFAIVEPGGQGGNENPNDGTSHNLSDNDPAGGQPTVGCDVVNPDYDPLDPASTPFIDGTGCGDTYVDRTFTVSGGKISTFDGTGHDTSTAYLSTRGLMINAMYFDDTSNNGGVYIMAICKYTQDDPATTDVNELTVPVTPSACKYDAFKAPLSTGEPPCTVDCDPDLFATISGAKYYDLNHDGDRDPGELGIAGWPIAYHDGDSGTLYTDTNGEFSLTVVAPDTFYFNEIVSASSAWTQTGNVVDQSEVTGLADVTLTNKAYQVDVVEGSSASKLYFGNVCVVANTGGLTLGFWSNTNGRAILAAHDAAWRTLMNGLNLYKPGTNKNFELPTTGDFVTVSKKNEITGGAYKVFRDWLLGADASKTSDMAYMTSAQMAATVLDYTFGTLDDDALVQDPDGNWVTIAAVVAQANDALGHLISNTPPVPTRSRLEAYKNIFDKLNNNIQQVTPPTSAGCPAPFPQN